MDRRRRGKRKSSNCIQRCLTFSFLRFMADPEMELGKKADRRRLAGLPGAGNVRPPVSRAQKQKRPDGDSGRNFLQGIAYQNRTWFVKREMQEKEPELASALKRGALPGDSYAGWHGNQVALGGTLIAGGVGEIAGQHAPVLAALVKAHVHNLKGHVLRAGIAHERRGLQISHANLQS